LRIFGKPIAVIGLTLIALSLSGSSPHSATRGSIGTSDLAAEIRKNNEVGQREYAAGKYLEARDLFLAAASLAQQAGDSRAAAMNWNNAGGAALARRDYRDAMGDFLKARATARESRQLVPLAITLNNLASLYLQLDNPEAAAQIAQEGLAGPASAAGEKVAPKLRFQLASALSSLHRFDEAQGFYWTAIDALEEQGDLDSTARMLASLGKSALEADRLDVAESALDRALMMVRIHDLRASSNVLRGLANLRSRQGDPRSAAVLFQAAIDAPESLMPRWEMYTDRGRFRISQGDLQGALSDFRDARTIAAQLRADIVPADQDRITLESGLGGIAEGLVNAGNLLAIRTSDRKYLRETFDVAERDRLWSLRALIPTPNDWRTRLPAGYWDLLARYQATERTLVAKPSAERRQRAAAQEIELQEIESQAAGSTAENGFEFSPDHSTVESPLAHVTSLLDRDTVLFSFHVAKSSGWLWAVDQNGVDAYSIPALENLRSRISDFERAAREGDSRATALGQQIYQDLFGMVPASYLSHKRWLLELDGPLFDLPFAALVVGQSERQNKPIYLAERAALQVIPGALMLEPRAPAGNGGFLGVGDPIYNAADSRYHGARTNHEVVLPRLPDTGPELDACSRALGFSKARILTGENAGIANVRIALQSAPAVIHFATHVVPAPDRYSSGLIALSLDRSGAMGLMGPTEIAAHPVSANLVVLNGCHSGQGNALPGAGLMGLTRAWIGAGARAVLATRWDIPDEAGKTMMIEFYRALRAHPEGGSAFALQQAQLALLKENNSRTNLNIWAAYFLVGRE
jgi:CHAT domain-containing protein